MRKVYMKNGHSPNQNEWGDCLRACVASLFELEAEDVPHFGADGPDGETMWRRVSDWLKPMKMRPWITVYHGSVELPEVLHAIHVMNGDAFYLVGGVSNTGVDHICVAQGDQIVFDPSRLGAGIQGPVSDGFYHIVTFVRDFA